MPGWLKVVLIIVGILVAMILISTFVPGVKEYAAGLAEDKKLPIWIVGLFAPILYLLKAVGDWLKGIFGGGVTEGEIKKEKEAIESAREKLLQELRLLEDWRTRELALRREEIKGFERRIGELKIQAVELDRQFKQVMATAPGEFTKGMSSEELRERWIQMNREMGIDVVTSDEKK